jgi:hypothetical protein
MAGLCACRITLKGQDIRKEGDVVGVIVFEGDEAKVAGGAFEGNERVGRLAKRDPAGAQRGRVGGEQNGKKSGYGLVFHVVLSSPAFA